MRARTAAGPIARASTGRTYESGPARPATGTQPRLHAEHVDEPDPSRKSGIAPSTTLVEVKPSSVAAPPAAAG